MKQSIANIISLLTTKNVFFAVIVSYLFLNLIYIFIGQLPFTSDSLYYYQKALECVEHGTFYPAHHNLYDQYIQSPLYINFLIVLLNIYNSPTTILITNVILNFLQVLLVYLISLKLFEDKQSARIAALVYIFYLTNLGAVLLNLTEFLFVTLILFSFYFYLKEKPIALILSGAAIGLALNIKQIAVMLLISFLLSSLYFWVKKRSKTDFVYLLVGFVIPLLIIGFATQAGFNKFIVTPETASVNILMGANDDANGAFNADVFEKGKNGYIEDEFGLTHSEKTAFYREQAYEWILDNPFNWLSLIPLKFIHMYAFDDWSIFTLTHSNDWNLPKIIKYALNEPDDKNIFDDKSLLFKVGFTALYIYHYIFYFLFLSIIVYQFIKTIKTKELFPRFLPIYLFTLLGTAAILIGVGAARYKYPFIILLIFTAVPQIKQFIRTSVKTNS